MPGHLPDLPPGAKSTAGRQVYRRALSDAPWACTLSIDEMTGIQALERLAPSLAMKPGQVERREFQYKRHGTQTLIAAFLDARLGEGTPDQQ